MSFHLVISCSCQLISFKSTSDIVVVVVVGLRNCLPHTQVSMDNSRMLLCKSGLATS